jgi:hypothetical protein
MSARVHDGASMAISLTSEEPFLISGSDLVGVVIDEPAVPDVHLSSEIVSNMHTALTARRLPRPGRAITRSRL